MAASKIEWTDRSDWNPIRGCTRKSIECVNCYAEIMAARFSDPGQWGHGFAHMVQTPTGKDHRWTGKVSLMTDRLGLPLRWRKPATIFPSSTSDIFHEQLDWEEIDRIFAIMALAGWHTFQPLTKRSDIMLQYLSDPRTPVRVWAMVDEMLEDWDQNKGALKGIRLPTIAGDPKIFALGNQGASWGGDLPWPLKNVWQGVSAGNQEFWDERTAHLREAPAKFRWVSAEPLIGPIVDGPERQMMGIDWIVAGGESGPGSRPMHPDWVRSLRDECAAAGVPFFFKQWGEWAPVSDTQEGDIIWRTPHPDYPGSDTVHIGTTIRRLGKKRAGRRLDGVQHDGFPA